MKFLLRYYNMNTIYAHALYQFCKQVILPFAECKLGIMVDHCFVHIGYSFALNEK
jgi:hypothetical protein